MNVEAFAKNLRIIRKLKNIPQEHISKALGLHRAAVSDWERGNSVPRLGKFIELCELLNISADAILDPAYFDIL